MKRYTMDTIEKRRHDAANHSTEIVKKRRVRRKLFKDGLADEHKEKEPVLHKSGGFKDRMCVFFFVFVNIENYYTVNTAQVTSNYHIFLILLIRAHASN